MIDRSATRRLPTSPNRRRGIVHGPRLRFGLVCALLALTGTASAAEPLTWAADADGGAPYVFRDPEHPDQTIGFEIDLAKALGAELKRPLSFKQYAYVSLLPGLDRRDFDFAMNGLEVTGDRARNYRLSRPYYIYRLQLVARADDNRFKSLEDCKAAGAVVGTLGETAAERLLQKKEIAIKRYDDQLGPYTDLAVGRIDAVLMDVPIADYYAKPNAKLKYVGQPVAEGAYAIALRKGEESLAAELDAAILRLYERGELERIYRKWGLWNDDQKQLPNYDLSTALLVTRGSMRFADYLPLLLRASWVTIYLSVASMALAIALGLLLATTRMYARPPLKWLAVAYIEFFRGIPMLLVLYFLYFGLPAISLNYHLPVSFDFDPRVVAILGFGLNYAAYEAEIYRAGIGSVARGQWEAAASLGMSPLTTFRRIILPQAIRTILPPMTNDFVALLKDTSLVSVIAVNELTTTYLILTKSSQQFVELGIATAALYLAMSLPLSYLSHFLERRWSKGQK